MTLSWPRRPATLGPGAAILLLGAILPALANGQTPPIEAEATIVSTPAKTKKVSDLTSRYRFIEKYTPDDGKAAPGMVGSYRVAILEVFRSHWIARRAPRSGPSRRSSRSSASVRWK